MNNPRYPIYIISKGRAESRLTSRALEAMNVPYRIVIEPQEFDQYAAVIDKKKILVLPFSNLGQGGIPARNWVWNHAISEGHKRHWILDDNIAWFARYNGNKKIRVTNGICFRVCEDFVDRYLNVPMAGMQYEMFVTACEDNAPIIFNTRIYSCILLSNESKYHHRWRGRYNEDTDLSLRFLKDGWCTILMCMFVCKKMTTMTVKGGNTESLYKLGNVDGRLLMAQSLKQQHPDVVKITRKWNRWQHIVNYKPFRKNKLKKDPSAIIQDGINEYGMKLVKNNGR